MTVQRCQYSLIKYAHDPLRHEPVNVGVVIWAAGHPDQARWRFEGTMKRIEQLYPSANPRAVKTALAAFKQIAEETPDVLLSGAGGHGSIVMTEPRAAHCADMEVELGDLFDTLVATPLLDAEEPREKNRSTRFIRGKMNEIFKQLGVFNALSSEQAQKLRIVECKSGVKHTFDFAYRNGAVHRIDAISFDHGTNPERLNRARSFANLVQDVTESTDGVGGQIEVVVQVPTEAIQLDVYQQAKKVLNTVGARQIEVTSDDDLRQFCVATKGQLHA